jgi:hypothetical protein
MNSKVLAIQSKSVVPESWAKCWQVSGRPRLPAMALGRRNRNFDRDFTAPWKLFVLICVLIVPRAIFAQTDQASWENLSATGAGHKIQVLELNSKKISGTFMNFSSTNISLQTPSGAETILRQDVRRVTLMENHHRLRNTLIGIGVGAGAGAIVGAASYQPCSASAQNQFLGCLGFNGTRGISSGIGAVIGGVGGAIVGALWPNHKTIYRSTDQ